MQQAETAFKEKGSPSQLIGNLKVKLKPQQIKTKEGRHSADASEDEKKMVRVASESSIAAPGDGKLLSYAAVAIALSKASKDQSNEIVDEISKQMDLFLYIREFEKEQR